MYLIENILMPLSLKDTKEMTDKAKVHKLHFKSTLSLRQERSEVIN